MVKKQTAPQYDPTWNAWHEARAATELLLRQYTTDSNNLKSEGTYRVLAVEHLTNAMRHLGYEVVKQPTPQEAHEAALARVRAEDPNDIPALTGAPGFDGRYRPLTVATDDRDSDLTFGR
jgi:hypothetical protein